MSKVCGGEKVLGHRLSQVAIHAVRNRFWDMLALCRAVIVTVGRLLFGADPGWSMLFGADPGWSNLASYNQNHFTVSFYKLD